MPAEPSRSAPHFLVIRDPLFNPDFYNVIVQWVGVNFPEFLPLFQFYELPYQIPSGSNVILHIPWMQDPVQQWSEEIYDQANALAAQCDERGIPIINRVDRLLNTTKSIGAQLMASVGIRTPRTIPIHDHEEFKDTLLGLELPLFVREDWGHGSAMWRANTEEEARNIALEDFARPVAVELIDLPDRNDGLYRKYRYVAAGNIGVSHHLQVSQDWVVRGEDRVRTELTRAQELSYITKPDPNHDALQRARRAMGLDFLAFDYGYDREGGMIVWEANPYPFIKFSQGFLRYRNPALHRTVLAALHMYLEYACVPVPGKLVRKLKYA